jgi:hypothetical protein
MSVWARSDLAYVFVSEAHRGCGQPHSRPVVNGAPVQPWRLDCEPCADHLRNDPMWSATAVEIPETYDEGKARENFEKRGAKDKDAILTLALARLAGIESSELPESLTRMISGVPAHVPGQMVCPSGHGNPPGKAFCGDCGQAMHGAPAQAAIPAPVRAAEPAKAAAGRPRRLRDAKLEELQALARGRALDSTGNRPELIARLSAAGVTSAALADLLVAA